MSGYTVDRPTKFCHRCGVVIDAQSVVCPSCGVMQTTTLTPGGSEKKILLTGLLWFFLGVFGFHRFYVGKIGTGLLMLFTFGGMGIWWLVDGIFLVLGNFTDKEGEKLTEWT